MKVGLWSFVHADLNVGGEEMKFVEWFSLEDGAYSLSSYLFGVLNQGGVFRGSSITILK